MAEKDVSTDTAQKSADNIDNSQEHLSEFSELIKVTLIILSNKSNTFS